jgi:miniconductance mechanosensitive channel
MFQNDPGVWLKELLVNAGFGYDFASLVSTIGLVSIVLFLSWLSNLIVRFTISQVVTRIVRRSKSQWDDIFLEQKVFTRLSHFAPVLVIWFLSGWALKAYPVWLVVVHRLTFAYMLVIGMVVINSFIESWYRIYQTLPISRHRSIKGYVQIVKIIVIVIFSLLIFSVVFKKEVSAIIAGLGVMASVIMLIFKDAILGLVASLQLSANHMLKVGDWITIPGKDVDGEVSDITLTTVKVKNFDKTILTVPTYSLVNESFQNWVGMEESGVRQIKRAFFIDMKSIRFADGSINNIAANIPLMKDFVNQAGKGDSIIVKDPGLKRSDYFSSGKITNLGCFRYYAGEYLRNHPIIDKKQTIIVRHSTPEGNGLPLQVYAFTNKTDFVTYENVQSEIFEHLLAMLNEFGLKVFQQPTGEDLLSLTKTN